MNKLCILLMMIVFGASMFSAPIYATTSDGKQVILYDNRTWDWVQQGGGGTPLLKYNLTGQWEFKWKLGIFDETFTAIITHGNTSLTIGWKDSFGTTTVTGQVISANELRFTGKSFYSGDVSFSAVVIDQNTLQGTIQSGGAFPKSGSFTAKRK
jgi:hypothetical protein